MGVLSPARKAAFEILMAVERGQTHSDELLRTKAVNSLPTADRNLATSLVLGVLRWQIHLDHQLHSLLKRPNGKLDPEIRIALRLGAFQLLHLDRIPARAAIDESVELAKQSGHKFASGMVNAVLRKLAAAPNDTNGLREPKALQPLVALDTPCAAERASAGQEVSGHGFSRAESPAEKTGALAPEATPSALAIAQAHPLWMVERWVRFYGLEATRDLCRHGQSQPVLTVRLEDRTVETELAKDAIYLEPGELLTAARSVLSGDIVATPAFKAGRIRLQDEGSQLVAELAGQGSAILDCCAAPGGKTLILAERNPQARILACDSSSTRCEQLRLRLAPLGDRVECRLVDAATLEEESVFDLALVDVPCSGTGTLGRNPEIRHRLRLEELPRQAKRQQEILTAALRAVRPGGRVVYSTCSLEPEENEQVVAAVLAATPGARIVSLQPRLDAMLAQGILVPEAAQGLRDSLTAEGTLRLLPGAFHTDGFFVALIQKTESPDGL
jgi:16S rRNA (cytosine967-C5)-methyltransferase